MNRRNSLITIITTFLGTLIPFKVLPAKQSKIEPIKEQKVKKLPLCFYIKTRYLREQRHDILNRILIMFKQNYPKIDLPDLLIDNKINPLYIFNTNSQYTYYTLYDYGDSYQLTVSHEETDRVKVFNV